MTTRKTKTLAKPAAQSREETEALIARIGDLQRDLQRREADHGDAVARLKETAEAAAKPLKEEIAEAEDRVARWCEANREALTKGDKHKTVRLLTGVISWRHRPPKVSIKGRKPEDVVQHLLTPGDAALLHLRRLFVRVKYELNKEAMRDHPEDAASLPGVSIGSAGEDFIIEPFGAEAEGAAA
ncbi:host-nuclease inhibitor protein Gam [Caulobacter sp. SLTY]|uniref:host-nuclease inhibitor Gam family protein n=1 Tax=Caulobacter sp. SLTY TaxID=2683262 RepID=UPI001412E8D3|nr:host-nuclease inhibitor Gam family protein [Caulobacter sp. SLTY]NBB17014.1 host-nuclease inhibitor protein Gam [Caulobacter sp. SLTY]